MARRPTLWGEREQTDGGGGRASPWLAGAVVGVAGLDL